ncbi:MAG TPA: hypothetical protein VNQ56_15600 [Pseudolabrys sp.]|nr:hypothetical protein [Pseudolabrys sp.]
MLHVLRCVRSARRLRPIGGDGEVVVERVHQTFDLIVETLPYHRIDAGFAAQKSGLHGREVGGRGPRIVDRHQRFVEGLGDERAGAANAESRISTESSGNCADCQKSEEDLATDRAVSPLQPRPDCLQHPCRHTFRSRALN